VQQTIPLAEGVVQMQDLQEAGGSRLRAERLRVFLRMHLSPIRAELVEAPRRAYGHFDRLSANGY